MELQKLKKALAKEAKAAGICKEWYNYILQAPSKERLMMLFVKGNDFVFANDYPSKALRDEFIDVGPKFGCEFRGAYTAKNPRRIIAYEGTSGQIELDNFAVSEVFARPGATMRIKVSGNAYLCLDITEGSTVELDASEQARVSIFKHGGSLLITNDTDNIKFK